MEHQPDMNANKSTKGMHHPGARSKYVNVLGSQMHYLEQGIGDPILFLHGVPTSSYVWRNIIPPLAKLGQCIAPDLIGFGKSEKPNINYSIEDHIKYINEFIKSLNLKNMTLILHGWGSIIGLDHAMKNQDNCKGLVFYEAYLRPMNSEDVSLPYQEQIQSLANADTNSPFMSDGSFFVDKVISQCMLKKLAEEHMQEYRQPFLKKGASKPLFQYVRELSDRREKDKIDRVIADYSEKLKKCDHPKLLLYSIPGFITTMATIMWAKQQFKNLELFEVGEDLHYAQESNPVLIGEAISAWMQAIEQKKVGV